MSSPTFSQLLTLHMQRAGISDSELARAIGVQRQTIFRWKEGLVSRPRVREDILKIAHKLRLQADERDQLLLAAGFPPEELAIEAVRYTPGLVAQQPSTEDEQPIAISLPIPAETNGTDIHPAPAELAQRSVAPRRRWFMGLWVGVLLLLVAGGLMVRSWLSVLPPPIPTVAPPTPTVSSAVVPYPSARMSETLILVAPFTGYTSSRYNVAGRVAEELENEIDHANLLSTTVAIWPDSIAGVHDAQSTLEKANAAAIIWGEYDSGRLRVNLTLSQQLRTQYIDYRLTSADELITLIDEQVPAEVRMFALLTVGMLYPLDKFYGSAARAYQAALDLHPPNEETRALLNFYLADAISQADNVEALEKAIDHYTVTLTLNPRFYGALFNRGTLWLRRSALLATGSPEIEKSLDAAIADFSATIDALPDYTNAYLNRGVAYSERNGTGDQTLALANFDQVVGRQRSNPRGYFNRALAQIRRGDPDHWQADLVQTLTLSPTFPAAQYLRCWGYALEQRAELALPACDEAVALDPSGASHDGRAIALAQLGRYAEAAADLRRYLAWARTGPASRYERQRGPQAQQWLKSIEQKRNPFDAALLASLR